VKLLKDACTAPSGILSRQMTTFLATNHLLSYHLEHPDKPTTSPNPS